MILQVRATDGSECEPWEIDYFFDVPDENFDIKGHLQKVLNDYVKTEEGKKVYEEYFVNKEEDSGCEVEFILNEIPQEFYKPYGFSIIQLPQGEKINLNEKFYPEKK